jgi:hypothetical protein
MPTMYKHSFIFRFNPDIAAGAPLIANRDGGWTENLWYQNPLTVDQMDYMMTKRTNLLCRDITCLGWRQTPYDYIGNKLIPKHGAVGSFFKAGKFGGWTNSPDDALRLQCVSAGALATWTQFLHAVPDNVIKSASFIQDDDFAPALQVWFQILQGRGPGAGRVPVPPACFWLGRDPSQVAQRVLSVNSVAGHITTQASTGAAKNVDYLRLRRVFDDNGLPIKGTFFVTDVINNADGSVTYAVNGLPPLNRTTPSGTARKDLIATSALAACDARLLASRKVGRPTSLYRGRRAKIRA